MTGLDNYMLTCMNRHIYSSIHEPASAASDADSNYFAEMYGSKFIFIYLYLVRSFVSVSSGLVILLSVQGRLIRWFVSLSLNPTRYMHCVGFGHLPLKFSPYGPIL